MASSASGSEPGGVARAERPDQQWSGRIEFVVQFLEGQRHMASVFGPGLGAIVGGLAGRRRIVARGEGRLGRRALMEPDSEADNPNEILHGVIFISIACAPARLTRPAKGGRERGNASKTIFDGAGEGNVQLAQATRECWSIHPFQPWELRLRSRNPDSAV